MLSLYLDWFYMCMRYMMCIALAHAHMAIGYGRSDSVRAGRPEASSCGMGTPRGAMALPLPARAGRQHTVNGSQ